ncbi:MAG: hypothetical protein FWH47_07715 [Methanomassiliicoccaceae archaeon]|nr:hypothetical protein [Methanomassiliicoccaceae archaeon]
MALGVASAAAGAIVYFMYSRPAGIALIVVGIAVLVITWTIAGVFYQIRMREEHEERKRMNEK